MRERKWEENPNDDNGWKKFTSDYGDEKEGESEEREFPFCNLAREHNWTIKLCMKMDKIVECFRAKNHKQK